MKRPEAEPQLEPDSKFHDECVQLLETLRARGVTIVVLGTPDRGHGMATAVKPQGDPESSIKAIEAMAGSLLLAGQQLQRDAANMKAMLRARTRGN